MADLMEENRNVRYIMPLALMSKPQCASVVCLENLLHFYDGIFVYVLT